MESYLEFDITKHFLNGVITLYSSCDHNISKWNMFKFVDTCCNDL